ncbi:glycerol-3-phosphate dehydrogenase [Synchytrium microbalum]|uniref:Glycerol-3-phosphate dehydrogenase n=1 Tax=Synchytrium microbalum TaxID=1806994 RepID=A0A507C5E7_9FUNG|nr:glycerol-3-phosphate dehydrogenase [Synchytrium microbalum]TPX34902.1 glycerol-3-phosphate dehydrogenase [Synchytrium microbalum]
MRQTLARLRRPSLYVLGAGVATYTFTKLQTASPPLSAEQDTIRSTLQWIPPSRKDMLTALRNAEPVPTGASNPHIFDLLIIGGGATGSGCAVDAATRGLKVAMIERDDFACGTSSRSTKLVHGGVRYLEKAFWDRDMEQLKLVIEALHERSVFLKIAPHLSAQIPIMLPIYKYWQVPYYWAGCIAYDMLAGREKLSRSYFLGKRKALEEFPMLKNENLVGALVYYDGQHNDARMNVALTMTAVAAGATVANHVEVVELLKRPRQEQKEGYGPTELYGAVLKDTLTGDSWTVLTKGVINATGPFIDKIRQMDDPSVAEIVSPSAGVHVILPNYYSPRHMGLVDPATSDGRVIFFLPWENQTIAGTTDSPCVLTPNPYPSEQDIAWILHEIENYLSPEIKVRRGDVLAAWSGIRPLIRDPHAKNTAGLVRSHLVTVSPTGLLTIAGGKWTTYRAMAQEAIDMAITVCDLKPTGPCITERHQLIGSHAWNPSMYVNLIQNFGLETEVAQHLCASYGDRAAAVASLASLTGKRFPIFGNRISQLYPYIEAEVRYAVRREYACTAVDVLARRTRLAFLNAAAAYEALDGVIDIMAEELAWTDKQRAQEREDTISYLYTMGLPPSYVSPNGAEEGDEDIYNTSRFRPEELLRYRAEFERLDTDNDGHITTEDLGRILTGLGLKMSQSQLENVINEVDLNKNRSIEFNEFLEVLSAVKDVKSKSKFARIIADFEDRERITELRSGGGV